jgi:hypothetical protein
MIKEEEWRRSLYREWKKKANLNQI